MTEHAFEFALDESGSFTEHVLNHVVTVNRQCCRMPSHLSHGPQGNDGAAVSWASVAPAIGKAG